MEGRVPCKKEAQNAIIASKGSLKNRDWKSVKYMVSLSSLTIIEFD